MDEKVVCGRCGMFPQFRLDTGACCQDEACWEYLEAGFFD